MLQWIEIATKLFNTDSRCCEWFMNTMAEDDWWPQQILIKCPNHTVRQVCNRVIIRQFATAHCFVQINPHLCKILSTPLLNKSLYANVKNGF